jgi:hypothetical protein
VLLRYDIYIGSDNDSRELTKKYLELILEWANHVFPDGYTIVKGDGYYNHNREEQLVVSTISQKELDLNDKIKLLKKRIKQDAILITKYAVKAELL